MKKNDIELEMVSKLQNIKIIRDFISGFLETEKVSKLFRDQLISIVDELITNVAEHAYNAVDSSEKTTKIILKKGRTSISLTVEDFGRGIKEINEPEKNSSENRGLGLKIVEGLSDDFKIINKDKGVKIEINKKIN
ncbi:MAG: ATP-binding protein [Fusobacteriota bacterium]